jgi:hypothetical protein
LEPEEDKKIPTVCHSFDMALDYLVKDRAFLKTGGLFNRPARRDAKRPIELERQILAGPAPFPVGGLPFPNCHTFTESLHSRPVSRAFFNNISMLR